MERNARCLIVADMIHRLTSDIYPGDLGWTVNWDKPEERQEWYHNMSSVMQAGPCVRSNQLDYDEDVMYKVSASTNWCPTALLHPLMMC